MKVVIHNGDITISGVSPKDLKSILDGAAITTHRELRAETEAGPDANDEEGKKRFQETLNWLNGQIALIKELHAGIVKAEKENYRMSPD